jgi:hypothetical protein
MSRTSARFEDPSDDELIIRHCGSAEDDLSPSDAAVVTGAGSRMASPDPSDDAGLLMPMTVAPEVSAQLHLLPEIADGAGRLLSARSDMST